MSRGIKMLSAVDSQNQLHTLESLQIRHDNSQTIPALFCNGGNCLTPVRFVPRGLRNASSNQPSDIAAYIGLTAGATSGHQPGCLNDAQGILNSIIANQSDRNFTSALNKGKTDLRVLVLHNRLGGKMLSGAANSSGAAQGSGQSRQPTVYQATDIQMDSYLRTTTDILKLRERCETDEVLRDNLRLKFGNKEISWSEFLFERNRYAQAWAMLKSRGDQCHPFALVGTVEDFSAVKPGAKNNFLNLHQVNYFESTTGEVMTYPVSIGHSDATWLQQYPANTEVIAFGVWKTANVTRNKAPKKQDPEKTTTYVNHGMTLYLKFKRQVVAV